MDPDVLSALEAARAWLEERLKENTLQLEDLSAGQRLQLVMQVPCSIRCWRVGVSIEIGSDGLCPECGKDHQFTFWDRLKLNADALLGEGAEEASRSKEPP